MVYIYRERERCELICLFTLHKFSPCYCFIYFFAVDQIHKSQIHTPTCFYNWIFLSTPSYLSNSISPRQLHCRLNVLSKFIFTFFRYFFFNWLVEGLVTIHGMQPQAPPYLLPQVWVKSQMLLHIIMDVYHASQHAVFFFLLAIYSI